MNKFIKVLIVVNGLIIPCFAIFLIYKLVSEEFGRVSFESEGVIVGKELEKAKSDSLALQGLRYYSPIEIYNSTNLYLPIAVKTYEAPMALRGLSDKKFGSGNFNGGDLSYENYFNIIFLDHEYQPTGQLVDRKATITEIFINGQNNYQENQIDKTVKNIAYSIGFNDSNNDGKLNSLDDHDLYISDLDGKNLTQVTTNKEVIDYKFINSNKEIFVRFKDRNNLKDEYKIVKFGLYDIESKTFTDLKGIEQKLLEIEKNLVK